MAAAQGEYKRIGLLIPAIAIYAQDADDIKVLAEDPRFSPALFDNDDVEKIAAFMIDWWNKYQTPIHHDILLEKFEQYVRVHVDGDPNYGGSPDELGPIPPAGYWLEQVVERHAQSEVRRILHDTVIGAKQEGLSASEAVARLLRQLGDLTINPSGAATIVRYAFDQLDRDAEPPTYYIEGLVLRGAITTMGGHSGAGKTPTELAMVEAMLGGDPFLELRTRLPEGNIVFATQEPASKFRFYMARAGLTQSTPNVKKLKTVMLEENTHVRWEDFVNDAAREAGVGGMVILDPAFDFCGADDENSSAQMRDMYRPLVKATAQHDLACLVTAHTTKGFKDRKDSETGFDDIRGSGAVIANSSIILLLKRSSQSQDFNYLKVDRNKVDYPWLEPFYTRLNASGRRWRIERAEELDILAAGNAAVSRKVAADVEKVVMAINSLNEENMPTSVTTIARRSGVRRESTGELLGKLVKDNRVFTEPVVLKDGSAAKQKVRYRVVQSD